MIKEELHASGKLSIKHIGASGKVIGEYNHTNLVVTSGKNYLVSRAVGVSKPVMSHIGIGAGTVAPLVGDIALGSQLGARVVLDSVGVAGSTVSYIATFGPGVGTGTVTEAGIFNDITSGDMLARTVFAPVNKAAGDTIIISWHVTIA
jgi:hypothetical protein